VLHPNGHTIEEVSAVYPYRYPYLWNGSRWKPLKSQNYGILWTVLGISPILLLTIVFGSRWQNALGQGMYLVILSALALIAAVSIAILSLGRD
jgi:hypothetical protein